MMYEECVNKYILFSEFKVSLRKTKESHRKARGNGLYTENYYSNYYERNVAGEVNTQVIQLLIYFLYHKLRDKIAQNIYHNNNLVLVSYLTCYISFMGFKNIINMKHNDYIK